MPITDLTGCTWTGNDYPILPLGVSTYNINFTSNNINYTSITLNGVQSEVKYNSTSAYSGLDDSWQNEAYKTIEITGGTDATNSTLIAWLEANGTLTAPQPTDTNKISVGTTKLAKAFVGNSEIASMWLGNTKIYEKGSPTPSGYSVSVYSAIVGETFNIYDGQNNTGTLLGTIAFNQIITFTITSGYIYAQTNGFGPGYTFTKFGSDVGNPATISENASLEISVSGPTPPDPE